MNGKHQITDPGSLQNSKQDVSQKINTCTYNIETAKTMQTKRQSENFGRIQKKRILYLQRKKNKYNKLLIRNHARREWGKILKMLKEVKDESGFLVKL